MTTEPRGRAEILQAIEAEAKAEDEGRPSTCVRCRKPIKARITLYRCVECGLPFHERCIKAHFRDHGATDPGVLAEHVKTCHRVIEQLLRIVRDHVDHYEGSSDAQRVTAAADRCLKRGRRL